MRILVEPSHLSDSSSAASAQVTEFRSTFTADTADVSGKTGNLYFMYEEHDEVSDAEKVYRDIYRSNKGHEGIEVIDDLGDEAYFHSDGENFYFILVRKVNRLIRMKVNKITSHSSLDEFHAVAREIVARM